MKHIRFFTLLSLAVFACKSSGTGGITIPQTDSSLPTLTLGAGEPNGAPGVTVNAGGVDQNLKIISKTSVLNLVATAVDDQSGIQALRIWVGKRTTTCPQNETCASVGPGLQGRPDYESVTPKKNPGDT